MEGVKTKHEPALAHHVEQGIAWISASADGENTAALSYAALELRYAIERISLHYWALLHRQPEDRDLRDIESFKRMERRIYDLAGNQKEIERHFQFMRVTLRALKIEKQLNTPNISRLSNYWDRCSELCHISWPFFGSSEPELRKQALSNLTEISDALTQDVTSLDWPLVHDAAFTELRDQFVAGSATAEDVQAHFERTGLWARVVYPDGRPAHFVGTAVPPRASKGL
jgi:hypothetical protein